MNNFGNFGNFGNSEPEEWDSFWIFLDSFGNFGNLVFVFFSFFFVSLFFHQSDEQTSRRADEQKKRTGPVYKSGEVRSVFSLRVHVRMRVHVLMHVHVHECVSVLCIYATAMRRGRADLRSSVLIASSSLLLKPRPSLALPLYPSTDPTRRNRGRRSEIGR